MTNNLQESPSIPNPSRLNMPPLVITDGTVEALKWIALFLMTADHINKYLFNETSLYLFDFGRVAMPIFVIILAHNLARKNTLQRGVHVRTMKRLLIFGTLATIPFMAGGSLYYGWYPLNILFMLLSLTAIVYYIEKRQLVAATTVFIIGGAITEFYYPAILFGLAVWFYARRPSLLAAIAALLSCSSLYFVNGNFWACAALPVVIFVSFINIPMPRFRWLFYVYYPLHLSILLLIRVPMSHAGYFFFYGVY